MGILTGRSGQRCSAGVSDRGAQRERPQAGPSLRPQSSRLSRSLREDGFLIRQDAIELPLIAKQPIELSLVSFDTLEGGEHKPLVGENLSLIGSGRIGHQL